MFYSKDNVFLKCHLTDMFFLSLKRFRDYSFYSISFVHLLLFSSLTWSGISEVIISDATTRAFSVVWVSDEPVNTASIRVYSDIDGTDNITSSLSISLISSNRALALGIVKIDVIGVEKDTEYFVDTVTDGESGLVIFPLEAEPLIVVKTAVETTKSDSENNPLISDLIRESIYDPNGIDVPSAGLLLINVPSKSQYPISAFIEENDEIISIADAVVDLNNLFDKTSGSSAKIISGETMVIKKLRGLSCNFEDHILEQIRRVPVHEEFPIITELESPGACFSPGEVSADFNCDGRIGGTDFIKFSGNFGLERPDCKFNSDFDLNADGRIGGTDFIRFSGVFGSIEE